MLLHTPDAIAGLALTVNVLKWFVERLKTSQEAAVQEADIESRERQNIIENYRGLNIQLQERLSALNEEVEGLRAELVKCQGLHKQDEARIWKLEKKNIDQSRRLRSLEYRITGK